MNKMLKHYLVTILFAETDNGNENGGEPLDRNYTVDSFAKESIRRAESDCDMFVEKAGNILDGLDMELVGHDFWLTRNGHGAGFWDGDYEKEIGIKLTEIAKSFGECHVYVAAGDNRIYMENF